MNDLLFQSLCSRDTLFNAWQRVKEKHTTGGIDRKTVEGYMTTAESNIALLSEQLLAGKYIQQPYLEVLIPKNETEKRRLGLLTVNDKIVQTAAAFLLNPVFEKSFLNVSYAYRSNKGAVKAIHKVQHLIANEKYTWLASCDIDNFFDTIPHSLLFSKLSSYLRSPGMVEIIRMFISMGRVNKHYKWKDSVKGIPQGGVVSPLLANFYLYPLDKLMVDNKYGFVRYADDFIILAKTEAEGKQALDKAVSMLTNHLQLQLNEGSKVTPVAKSFEFLGIVFTGATLSLSERKYKRLTFKMLEASRTGEGIVTTKLLEVVRGILVFYAKLIPQETLCLLDDELMAILRNKAGIEKDSPVKRNQLVKELQKLEFFASQHNFRRREYIESRLSISREKQKSDDTSLRRAIVVNCGKAVVKRKHEYHKLEAAGFDLLINTPGTWIGKRENKIVVKHKDSVVREVLLINLKNITIQSEGVVFSSNVIAACAENRIMIDFLKHDGKPYAIIHQPDWFEADTGIAQLEAYRNGKGFQLIRQMVWGKICNQINLLKYYGKYYTSRIEGYETRLEPAINAMEKYAEDVLTIAEGELDDFRMKIFAFEGLASASYWDTIGILINTNEPFERRERQGATDLVNCMFNYGYGILYSRIVEALVRAGLNPNLSYLHKPENNRPSLVYDLIEEFRQQAVDRVVFAIIMKNNDLKADNGLLDDYTKKLLAKKVIERLNNVEIFRKKEMRMYEIIYHQARDLARFLKGEKTTYRPYIRKW
jgi:group II intron reverse transcriptase/maturase/CRISPR-associated endonuclease Cas1